MLYIFNKNVYAFSSFIFSIYMKYCCTTRVLDDRDLFSQIWSVSKLCISSGDYFQEDHSSALLVATVYNYSSSIRALRSVDFPD